MKNISSIHDSFQKLLQPKQKTQINRVIHNGLFQLNGFNHLVFYKFPTNDLRHYGIFAGDTLKIERGASWENIDKHSLYAVILPDNSVKISAIKIEKHYRITLHDGLGDNFETFRRFRLDLVGIVLTGGRYGK